MSKIFLLVCALFTCSIALATEGDQCQTNCEKSKSESLVGCYYQSQFCYRNSSSVEACMEISKNCRSMVETRYSECLEECEQ